MNTWKIGFEDVRIGSFLPVELWCLLWLLHHPLESVQYHIQYASRSSQPRIRRANIRYNMHLVWYR